MAGPGGEGFAGRLLEGPASRSTISEGGAGSRFPLQGRIATTLSSRGVSSSAPRMLPTRYAASGFVTCSIPTESIASSCWSATSKALMSRYSAQPQGVDQTHRRDGGGTEQDSMFGDGRAAFLQAMAGQPFSMEPSGEFPVCRRTGE